MQTFLPYADFAKSAEALDYRRLGKQRVEAFQLLIAIDDPWACECLIPSKAWKNHPAAIMWRGHNEALRLYMNVMIREWVKRGYINNMLLAPCQNIQMPSWIGNESFHASHRANLLRKNVEFYSQYGWTEDPTMPYLWPVP